MSMIQGDIDRVLVLIKLNGGNDGLNTIIPLEQYANLIDARVRKDIMVAENKILRVNGNDTIGFNPAMVEMAKLFNAQKLSIVQGVANTSGIYSHFHGMDQWESASDQFKTYSSGWIGRYIEKTYHLSATHYPNQCMKDPLAIEIGTSSIVTRGTGAILAQNLSPYFNGNVTQLLENYDDSGISENMKRELDFIRQQQGFTNDYGNKIINAWKNGTNSSSVTYPNSTIPSDYVIPSTTLSQQLKIVARLVKGGLKTRIFVVSIGNFDTHFNQGKENGWHHLLLKDLSDAIGAFQKDIENLNIADRIIGMTYSEFGRRVAANSGGGTEHGLAAPLFIFGNKVKGSVIGQNYKINDISAVNAFSTVPIQYDYRQVYTSVLQDWFSVCKSDAVEIIKKELDPIPGIFKDGTSLTPCILGPLINPLKSECIVNIIEVSGDDHSIYARIQPNPTNGQFTIIPVVGFDFNSATTITIHSVNGALMYSENKVYSADEKINIHVTLVPGIYIVGIQNNKFRLNQKISVQY